MTPSSGPSNTHQAHPSSLKSSARPDLIPSVPARHSISLKTASSGSTCLPGPHQYEQIEIRHEIYRLFWKRGHLRTRGAGDADLKPIAEKMRSLNEKILCGYIYTGSVYREIGMQNSDFGGMENVGNTTIMTNRLMPFTGMTDPGFEYLLCVKVHEYYHNVNGSEVTGSTPFEIWLNEAVTVHIERQYHAFHFGEEYSRLKTLLSLLDPADGTLARDTGAAAMPIEPEGFNDPDD